MYENYLKRKQIEWKEIAKEKKKKQKRVIFSQPTGSGGARPRGRPRGPFSPDWYKQPGLKGLHSIPVNRPGIKGRVGSPG
jgi:hypothetical protein